VLHQQKAEAKTQVCEVKQNQYQYMYDAITVIQPTASKHWRNNGPKFLQATGCAGILYIILKQLVCVKKFSINVP